MRRTRLPLGLIVPAALLLLVATLATLQYRWLGQVSEAERDALRTDLDRRARAFADDFDGDINRAYAIFQLNEQALTPEASTTFAGRFDQWRTAAHVPALVKRVYVAREDNGQFALSAYDAVAGRLDEVAWPDHFAPVRARIAPNATALPPAQSGRTQVISLSSSPIVTEVPALVIPVVLTTPSPAVTTQDLPAVAADGLANMMFAMRMHHAYVIVELDRTVLVDQVLPALATQHFGSDRYRVSVVDAQSTAVMTRGLAPGAVLDPEKVDARAALFSFRPELARDALTAAGTGGVMFRTPLVPAVAGTREVTGVRAAASQFSIIVERGSGPAPMRVARVGWQVLLQHEAGSLDAAVAQARQRNLWLSFGILSTLAVSMGLVLLNARRSERLAEQQMDFVATVSHELRTPLAVIRSAAQNLSAGVIHDEAQARRYGDLIETEGRRLTDMVEQVLDYAGLTGNRRPLQAAAVDAGEIVRDVLASCAPLIDVDGMTVAVEIESSLPPVLADRDALRRALHNLVTNALKYGADGHWLGVTVERGSTRGQAEVHITVSDRGRGIDADDLPHVFEPFYRGRYAREQQVHGNGLGLSLVRRIAEAHGGRATVKSVPGQGAAFTVHLPALIARSATVPESPQAAATGSRA